MSKSATFGGNDSTVNEKTIGGNDTLGGILNQMGSSKVQTMEPIIENTEE